MSKKETNWCDSKFKKKESTFDTGYLVISANEIKRILAEHFSVPESDVIKSKYSWIIIKKEVKNDE